MRLQQPPDIHGVCICRHCEPRGNNRLRPSWYYCAVRAKQVAPRLDCGETCYGYEQRTQHGGTEQRMASKGRRINWDGPAEDTIPGAGQTTLRKYCVDKIDAGAKINDVVKEVGCSWDTLKNAIAKPAGKPVASGPATVGDQAPEPTLDPVAPPVPMDTTPEPDPDVVYQAPVVPAPAEPREHIDLELDASVVREFLIAMGMGQVFAGFALARQLDKQRTA